MKEKISDIKIYFIIIGVILLLCILFSNMHTILPIIDDDEYFVDEYGNIHGESCPYKSVPWFTTKHSKYNILIIKGQKICRECLLLEEDKLLILHDVNVENEINRLRRAGASEEYINNKIDIYE